MGYEDESEYPTVPLIGEAAFPYGTESHAGMIVHIDGKDDTGAMLFDYGFLECLPAVIVMKLEFGFVGYAVLPMGETQSTHIVPYLTRAFVLFIVAYLDLIAVLAFDGINDVHRAS